MDDDMVPLIAEVLPDWLFGSILHAHATFMYRCGNVMNTCLRQHAGLLVRIRVWSRSQGVVLTLPPAGEDRRG
jgi:hypothetical protein